MVRRLAWLLFPVLLAASAGPGRAADPPEDLEAAFQRVLEVESEVVSCCARVRRSTVSVLHRRFPVKDDKPVPGEPSRVVGVGSGVVIERKGKPWVVTNVHVVQGADEVEVVGIDGLVLPVRVHDTIALYDIALLAFLDRPKGLAPVRVDRKASQDLEVGTWVVATGNPFSLAVDGQCVATFGVVSGRDRILPGDFFYGNAIQHDAPVNPGNSGGPLWNLKGELIGINGKISSWSQFPGARPSNTGASYSLPIHQVSEFLLALIDRRTDARAGFLGLEVETSTDESGRAAGATVKKVDEKSPARQSKTAVREGDVLVSVFFGEDWHRVRTASDLTNLLALASPGDFLKIRYRRGRVAYVWSGRLGSGR